MKQWLFIFLLCWSSSTMNLSRLLRSNHKNRPSHQKLCLNAPRSFGSTHFIMGYNNKQKFPDLSNKPIFTIAEAPYLIDGSSAHLIDETRQTQSFFTTVHNIHSIMVNLIDHAKDTITIAVFSLTDSRIANALILAHKRNVDVCVIMDKKKMKERYSRTQDLINNSIPVWYYEPSLRTDYKKKEWSDPLMHHKCMVIDNIAITGSANSTKAAQIDNIENITIIRDPLTVEEHRQEFIRLKQFCIQYPKAKKNVHKK